MLSTSTNILCATNVCLHVMKYWLLKKFCSMPSAVHLCELRSVGSQLLPTLCKCTIHFYLRINGFNGHLQLLVRIIRQPFLSVNPKFLFCSLLFPYPILYMLSISSHNSFSVSTWPFSKSSIASSNLESNTFIPSLIHYKLFYYLCYTIIVVWCCNIISIFFHCIYSIFHCNTNCCIFNHWQIIKSITTGNCIFMRYV